MLLWNPQNILKCDSLTKYEGVKEFHMLAHIGVIVKLWFSVLSNLKSHIITQPREEMMVPLVTFKTPKMYCKS